jgi:hypothetical protein
VDWHQGPEPGLSLLGQMKLPFSGQHLGKYTTLGQATQEQQSKKVLFS